MRKLLQLRFTFILVPAIILLLVFLSGFTGKTASADMSGQHTMKSYENVLIKSGDTLSSLADTYAEKYSNLSKAEYEEAYYFIKQPSFRKYSCRWIFVTA